ncbi:MAG: hypothetical protein LBV52_03105, partial [Spirochaetaceae bacterium]|nr:hypothetical protein [Spirochaetaceae bacterium]
YVDEIKEQIREKIKPYDVKQQKEWSGLIALRIKPLEIEFPDIVLLLDYDNLFKIDIFYDDQSGKKTTELNSVVGNKYEQKFDGKCICYILKKDYYFNNLNAALKEVEMQFNKMKQIYS